jgi:hypothetical protein
MNLVMSSPSCRAENDVYYERMLSPHMKIYYGLQRASNPGLELRICVLR